MDSESLEEYLEAIYSFNEKGKAARTKELAERLGVSPPSVTQMVKKMAERGLVEYEAYRGVTLTGRGMALAQRVVRKHRLLERLLYDFLGLRRERIHDEACRLEHGLSDDVAMALCKALDKPKTCPDDKKPIPPCPLGVSDCSECEEIREREEGRPKLVTQLSNLRPGERGKVTYIRGGGRACQRLLDMGFTPGTDVQVINAAPFRGPMEISVRGTTVALGRGLAGRIFVELEASQPIWRPQPQGPHHGKD